jgi:hypothetical protein
MLGDLAEGQWRKFTPTEKKWVLERISEE